MAEKKTNDAMSDDGPTPDLMRSQIGSPVESARPNLSRNSSLMCFLN